MQGLKFPETANYAMLIKYLELLFVELGYEIGAYANKAVIVNNNSPIGKREEVEPRLR